jgi:hypothetical protein
MEWKILKLDKTVESTLDSTEALETLLLEASASRTEEEGQLVAYFYYCEGLFDKLEEEGALTERVRIVAHADHYVQFLAEMSGSTI